MPALLASIECASHVHLIVGHNPLASARVSRSLELGAQVKLLAPGGADMHYALKQKIDDGEIEWVKKDVLTVEDLTTLGRPEVDGVVDAVFVTLPVGCAQNPRISALCKKLRIPVNVADSPSLCTFTLLSTYSDGPLQIGVTTSGRGCKLASRIRREIVSTLPPNIGSACERLGKLRRRIWEEDFANTTASTSSGLEVEVGGALLAFDEDDDLGQKSTFNKLVTQDDYEAAKSRRIRWLSQICEYWPLEKLCNVAEQDIDGLLRDYSAEHGNSNITTGLVPSPPGSSRIYLVGSGPGHPDLLTTASLKAIQSADLILADKLVPSAVLSLVPRRTPIHIARKFPGNADAAQEELLELGLAALKEGKRVIRLKQGDPYIYGRGAEEYDFFTLRGYGPVVVVPGITSALSAPLFAAIPATHRGVADQVLIVTGTGRKGEAPEMPEYVKSRTTVFLMALHRLGALVESLVVGKRWPKELPCAVVERASCKDQRVIRSTLEGVVAAVEVEGSRPPGLLVVGWACGAWVVEEGFREF
ncbi:tetrapyrrole methylase [Kalaharituber pfeilii]|nr:tetrapyrrole methylase [Kalaharituber pfeilii]